MRKRMTQAEVDRLIDQRIDRAVACEARRNASPYESPEYWRHHDRAQHWHWLAEQLMPVSARTITKD
jgi:hypothetical protein